jgi:hypothetical protein
LLSVILFVALRCATRCRWRASTRRVA